MCCLILRSSKDLRLWRCEVHRVLSAFAPGTLIWHFLWFKASVSTNCLYYSPGFKLLEFYFNSYCVAIISWKSFKMIQFQNKA